MRDDHGWFRQTLTAMLFGMLLMAGFPAIAAQVGDALALGEVNRIDDRTDLKGKAKGANLQIKNTGNAAALTAKADRNAIKAKATSGPVALNAKASRNAVKIRVDAGQAPLKVNAAAGTVTNLSADQLDGMDSTAFLGVADTAADAELLQGFSADGLVRFGFASEGDLPDGSESPFTDAPLESGDVLTVDIDAPGSGFLMLTGTVDAFGGLPDGYSCEIQVDGVTVPGTFMISHLATDNTEENCFTHGAIPVLAGDHSVALRLGSVSASTDLFDGSLTVLFVPFGATGDVPVVEPDASADSPDASTRGG